MRKVKFLEDARKKYPSEPSNKVMGAIFFNLGVRLAVACVFLLFGSWLVFLPRMSVVGQLIWGGIIIATLVHTGYFLYTFHLYLQENMYKALERRQAEQAKAKKEPHPSDHTPKPRT